jgi:hypothetical protein
MENFETQEGFNPKISKKVGLIIWAIITVVLVGIIAIQIIKTEWKKIENGIYQKGITSGANQLYYLQVKELFSTGQLKMGLPATGDYYDINGTGTKQIILIPKQ